MLRFLNHIEVKFYFILAQTLVGDGAVSFIMIKFFIYTGTRLIVYAFLWHNCSASERKVMSVHMFVRSGTGLIAEEPFPLWPAHVTTLVDTVALGQVFTK
jgi:hypothetical protein